MSNAITKVRLQGLVSRGVGNAFIDENGHLKLEMTDGSIIDVGLVVGGGGGSGGTIRHSWNGTVLTVTSDNGTSSADLEGPQGPAGISPKLRIDQTTYEWEMSEDGGVTWTALGVKAKGEDGEDGEDGAVSEAAVEEITQSVVQYINNHSEEVTVGAECFVVTFTQVDEAWTADKTFAEVKAAHDGGDVVVCDCAYASGTIRGQLMTAAEGFVSFWVPYWTGVDTYMNLYDNGQITSFTAGGDEDSVPVSVAAVKSDSIVTVTASYGDGTTSVTTITLDDSGMPLGVTKDGKDCALTWEGFE